MADEMKQRNMTSLYLYRGEKYLLLKRQGSRVVNDVWIGSAGGHLEQGELNDAQAGVLRELREELGLNAGDIGDLKLRYITMRHTQDEIRVNYYFFAELLGCGEEFASNEGETAWFDEHEMKRLPMPFTAERVVKHYLAVGRHNDDVYGGIADGENVVFVPMPEF